MSCIVDEADKLLKEINSHDAYLQLKNTVQNIKNITIQILQDKSLYTTKQPKFEEPLEEIIEHIVELFQGTVISLKKILGEESVHDLSTIDTTLYFKIRDEK